MTLEKKEQLIKRLKAFAWHTGAMLGVVTIDFVIANLGLFDLPNEVTVVLGLVLAQISKYLSNKKDAK